MGRVAGVVLILAVVAACQTTTGQYSDWRRIGVPESRLQLSELAGLNSDNIVRRARSNFERNQEYWTWNGGELFMESLMPYRYFEGNYDDNALLVRHVGYWKKLKELGVTIAESDVLRTHNSFGDILYAVKDSDAEGRRCFVAVGYWRALQVAGPGDGNPSAYARAYSCVGVGSKAAARLEETMLGAMKSARFIDR